MLADRSPAASPAADALPALDEVQAARAHAAARCLAVRGLDVLCAPVRAGKDEWYLGETFAFRPAPARSAPAGAAAEALAAALDANAALLDEIESALGLAAEFSAFGPLRSDCNAVQISRGGEDIGSIAVFRHPPLAPPARASEPARLVCIAARLPLAEAQALGPGDMVLLTAGTWAIIAQDVGAALPPTLAFDPATGRIGAALLRANRTTQDDSMTDPSSPDLTVPVSLHLSDTVLSAEELDDLATGGTVLLGPVEEGVRVDLLVGGRAIGRGELVRLGDRFAVLLADPAASADDAAQEPGEADKDAAEGDARS